jgi:mono/diheme cytochrome c family protein
MIRRVSGLLSGSLLFAAAGLYGAPQQAAPSATPSPTTHRALLDKYCVTCHSDKLKTGGLTLQSADLAKVAENAEMWEKVIKKVRVEAMPPQGLPRPDKATLDLFASSLENSIDREASVRPNPGRSTLHRLNRSEYANAIRDLLALDVDPASLLPPDDESYGFDNIADVLKTSPALLERYMSASWNISRLAVGNLSVGATSNIYRARADLSQTGHLEGLPLGTRGGIVVKHNFPVDGEYVIKVRLWRVTADMIRGLEDRHQVEISVDGVRARLATIGGPEDQRLSETNSGQSCIDIDNRLTVRVPVKAGPREVIATFLTGIESQAQDDNILKPFIRSNYDVLDYRGEPVVDRITIEGPLKATGVSDTPSRRRVFSCRPANGADEVPCAKKIISTLARHAYRRPVNDNDMETLIGFYSLGRNSSGNPGGNFELGIEAAIQRILASPEFIFRFEPDPANATPDKPYRISDLEMASRLSFFLWSSIPDDQLLTVATQGKLKDPAVLEQQVRRMLADKRSETLVTNFADQWLYLRNLKNFQPDFQTFPDFDDNLRQAMKRETELFFGSIIAENRSVIDLLTADYTFVNERLARHYGIPRVYGTDFRRVTIADPARRGLLGQGSILSVTSMPNRTSPVLRGKWILTNILGNPPNPPPPNVPQLKENEAGARKLSLRERMEAHRADPGCAGCHKTMDPLGFSLENFDAVGQWRTTDDGSRIDPSGTLFNGAKVDGPLALRSMLTGKPDIFASVLTEKLMTYALGRGVEYSDMPTVRGILKDAAANNYRFSSIVLGIVKSTPFEMKEKKSTDGESVRAGARP